jgi:site-specific DNA-cytosine methylase
MTKPKGHVAYSVSDLDMRMIKAVPPGGNWKDIPLSVPSKRLEQIRASGGRTTLYGRLQWDKPSFTITTYFNRPGNGTYIHPEQDRVLTSLEAARLQSFPDDYIFSGSKTSRTKQIGNAVPPLLAFAIGRQIRKSHPGVKTSVDLFCGAGGLTLGLQWAGFDTKVANDFFFDAGETFKLNNPKVKYIGGDITSSPILQEIVESSRVKRNVDLIVGGPPCQGFSNAGLRMIDDPRNLLYKNFVEVVGEIKPKIFVMENVEGIISINGGKTFAEIKQTFTDLGYDVTGRKLHAAQFGVPQKRKRVVIIGSRIGNSSKLFPEPILNSENFLTVFDAIGDLSPHPTLDIEEVVKLKAAATDYQRLMQGIIDAPTFMNLIENQE